ncbi:MAG: FCD domain-containing protein [Propionibacteriaceae bacterium]|nr:FCD domain-containing protein [Propionibacteriaceae bacterium]
MPDASALTRHGTRALAHALSNQLRARILAGELAAGAKLPTESELSASFGVSRTVVREALQHLQASGLVETFQGRGSYVLAIPLDTADGPLAGVRTRADLTDLIEFRIGLESEAAALAAERRTPTQLTALQRALDAFAAAAHAPQTVIGADFDLHLAVAHASGNRFMITTLESFGPRMVLLQRTGLDERASLADSAHFTQVLTEHAQFVDAIGAGDAAAAGAAMRVHLAGSRRRLRTPG